MCLHHPDEEAMCLHHPDEVIPHFPQSQIIPFYQFQYILYNQILSENSLLLIPYLLEYRLSEKFPVLWKLHLYL